MGQRESLGKRAREKGLGKHPVMYNREEDTGVPLRDATCFELRVGAVVRGAPLNSVFSNNFDAMQSSSGKIVIAKSIHQDG